MRVVQHSQDQHLQTHICYKTNTITDNFDIVTIL